MQAKQGMDRASTLVTLNFCCCITDALSKHIAHAAGCLDTAPQLGN